LLAATLYQGNPDRNHKIWNIVSTEIYAGAGAAGYMQVQVLLQVHMQVLLECCYI
jgi:hypothetical protein